ncbi:glycosyltransferase family 4 protein [Chryseolinea sp. H1M3-3]|uniref:glycosyltransferase family 4 protein n=1 Tax=Chryseolinea sp. H1M3-3 TaxID=3034144 RepID=UPI0023EC4DA5|nr:glycosyltransferase family 4 protein [Chryseolinea sp. H1M3-3]
MDRKTVLMFGWEFPPHISGGLGTACYGLTKSLMEENIRVLFVVPHAYGDEKFEMISASKILVGATEEEVIIPGTIHTAEQESVEIKVASTLVPYTNVESWHETKSITKWTYEYLTEDTTEKKIVGGKRYAFTGSYGPSLMEEVVSYAEVASVIAQQYSFDLIHAHDWLTYRAGIEAKKVSGKPLIIHVHATEYDRAGEKNINPEVFEIEREGMEEADLIIAVSHLTKDIVVSRYNIPEDKVRVVHNGITPDEIINTLDLPKIGDHIVTFLGRITYQKGPQYFIEAARIVLDYFPETHFIMAGSGDLLPAMMERVAQLKMSSRFHFTGFLKADQIHRVWSVSDLYVMPSVSEPFGITPLEAIQSGVPVIVSNQSGVAEVMEHAIKIDFWDIDAMASAMLNVLKYKKLSSLLQINSKRELESLTWTQASKKIKDLYHELTAIIQPN